MRRAQCPPQARTAWAPLVFLGLLLICLLAPALSCAAGGGDEVPRTSSVVVVVQEVDRRDWHLLDGDQLLARVDEAVKAHTAPPPPPPLPPSSTATASRLDCGAPPPRSSQARAVPPSSPPLLPHPSTPSAAPRSAAREGRLGVSPAILLWDAADAAPAAHHGGKLDVPAGESAAAQAPPRVSLEALRLVIRFREEADESDGTAEAEEVPAQQDDGVEKRRRVHQRHGAAGAGGSTGVPQRRPSPTRAHRARKVAPVVVASRARAGGETPARTAPVDEGRLRDCIVANGRASEAAVMKAFVEGRLRKDCLIVAADVGNDIPGNENNAKAVVAGTSLFLCTLFCVFAFLF